MTKDGQRPAEALETVEGAALATELVDMLEAELVRFRHRVAHDHGIELDRARAAMVILGKLVSAGVPWKARPDSDPARVHESFSAIVPRDPVLAPVLKREIAAFFAATAAVEVSPEDSSNSPYAILRRLGAEPSVWWWAASYSDPARCWAACANDTDKTVQIGLAFGVPPSVFGRSLASALALLATRVKTQYLAQRKALCDALTELATGGMAAIRNATLVGAITKLTFELTAARQLQGVSVSASADAVPELAILAFQLIEALQTAKSPPDLERFASLANRSDRLFSSRGLQLVALLRKDLEPAAAIAIPKLKSS